MAVLIVFTILLTRRDPKEHRWFQLERCCYRACGVWRFDLGDSENAVAFHRRATGRTLTVKQIGETLMSGYVWPLQCVGLLLTAALIGALVLVMEEKR